MSLMHPTDKNMIANIKQRELGIYMGSDGVACISQEDKTRIETDLSEFNLKNSITTTRSPLKLLHHLPMIATKKVDNEVDKRMLSRTNQKQQEVEELELMMQVEVEAGRRGIEAHATPQIVGRKGGGGGGGGGGAVERGELFLDDNIGRLRSMASQLRHGRSGLVMVGNGANPANEASADWFINAVWPELRTQLCFLTNMKSGGGGGGGDHDNHDKECDVTFKLVGADWNQKHGEIHGVEMVGFLSEEKLIETLRSSSVFVSPITASTGLNTKNLLALEHGILFN
jgi:hypothetical protein